MRNKLELPPINKLYDLRKYLLIIETLELQKLENAISIKTKTANQKETISNLKMIKSYYGEMTSHICKQQQKQRKDELEEIILKELANFTHFWEIIMEEFRIISKEEIKNLITNNEELSKQVNS